MEKAPSILQLLEEQRDNLDFLCSYVSRGIKSQSKFEDCEEEASAIGKGLRDAFRKGRVS